MGKGEFTEDLCVNLPPNRTSASVFVSKLADDSNSVLINTDKSCRVFWNSHCIFFLCIQELQFLIFLSLKHIF